MKLSFLFAGVLAAGAFAADLPIREVILYKSGVGYFERSGALRPGESARLDFKASNMNDVLKSLTLEDRNGGKVTGLRYDSSEPLNDKLQDFPFQVEKQASLALFMDQMKGARVEIKFGAETVDGVIVSGRLVAADDKHAEREQLVLLLDSGELRSFDLGSAGAIRFAEPKLQAQIKDYLAMVNQSRSQQTRSIYIDSSDAKERQIAANYMIPTPVWKSSYRLIFGEKAEPTLEGWAIIDNTTGEDWTNIKLAVVSGRPVSFISKLYEPKYVPRQTVELPEDRAAGPVVYSGGVTTGSLAGGVAGGQAGGIGPQPSRVQARALKQSTQMVTVESSALGVAADENGFFSPSDVALSAVSAEVGELFEYRFASPVTVKKEESVMLPFLQQEIGSRKLLIYSESYGEHPMNATELTNSTGKTLDGGPITVFEGASYAGEGLMSTLKAGDKRLISYAVDLGTRVTTQFDSNRTTVREIHANRGLVTTRTAAEDTKTYTIRNADKKAKTLIIEQGKRSEFNVINQKPTETTVNAYRFEVKLGPDSTEKFPLVEERVYDTNTSVSSLTPDLLVSYIQNKAISDAGRRALQQILDLKSHISDLDSQIRQAGSDISAATADETRVRQNIQSLNQVSGQQDQVQNYARQLAAKENQLAAFRDRESDLKKQKAAQESNLSQLMEKIEF
jgi:hypothetical protein